MSTILVIDSDDQLRDVLRISLAARGHRVHTAADGTTALRLVADAAPDLVVLQLLLPDIEGIAVLRSLRSRSDAPILTFSVSDDPEEKIRALDSGADDHITQPFDMKELLARVRAALRRGVAPIGRHRVIDTGSFSVDLDSRKVWREGQEVHLTPIEWGLLETLVLRAGHVVTQKELLETVWGSGYGHVHYLRVYMGQLRRKLEPLPVRPRHLITEPGMGYRFELTREN